MPQKGKPLSVLAYAEHRKTLNLPSATRGAVQRAIESGRLKESVVVVRGMSKIADAELADREWAASTRPRSDRTAADPGSAPPDPDSYAEARRRREQELYLQAQIKRQADELDLAERRGDLVRASEVRAAVAERYMTVRTKLLGVPARVKQRLPMLEASEVAIVDDLIREALEELADAG